MRGTKKQRSCSGEGAWSPPERPPTSSSSCLAAKAFTSASETCVLSKSVTVSSSTFGSGRTSRSSALRRSSGSSCERPNGAESTRSAKRTSSATASHAATAAAPSGASAAPAPSTSTSTSELGPCTRHTGLPLGTASASARTADCPTRLAPQHATATTGRSPALLRAALLAGRRVLPRAPPQISVKIATRIKATISHTEI